MNSFFLSIPDQQAEQWLHVLADIDSSCQLELSFDVLNRTELMENIAVKDLKIAAVRYPLVPEITRNVGKLSDPMRQQALYMFRERVALLHGREIDKTIIDAGFGRPEMVESGGGFDEKVNFIKELMPAAASYEVQVCLRSRFPPAYPGDPQWDHVGNIIHEVMHPNCRLALDLFPNETEPEFSPQRFLRECGYHIALIRFNFDPLANEALSTELMSSWRQALEKYNFRGDIGLRLLGEMNSEQITGIVPRLRAPVQALLKSESR